MGKVAKELNDCPFCGGKGTIKKQEFKRKAFHIRYTNFRKHSYVLC